MLKSVIGPAVGKHRETFDSETYPTYAMDFDSYSYDVVIYLYLLMIPKFRMIEGLTCSAKPLRWSVK